MIFHGQSLVQFQFVRRIRLAHRWPLTFLQELVALQLSRALFSAPLEKMLQGSGSRWCKMRVCVGVCVSFRVEKGIPLLPGPGEKWEQRSADPIKAVGCRRIWHRPAHVERMKRVCMCVGEREKRSPCVSAWIGGINRWEQKTSASYRHFRLMNSLKVLSWWMSTFEPISLLFTVSVKASVQW